MTQVREAFAGLDALDPQAGLCFRRRRHGTHHAGAARQRRQFLELAAAQQGRAADAVAPLLAGLSSRQQQLDVTQLHKVVLEKLLGLDQETVRAGSHVRYLREASEALAQVGSGNADAAFLIKPVTLDQMKEISLNLEVMPQKSTDFYPKLLSGLAMYTLD